MILIDISLSTRGVRGMGAYAKDFAAAVPTMVPVQAPAWLPTALLPIWEQLMLPVLSLVRAGNLVVCPGITFPIAIAPRCIVIVHDLMYMRQPPAPPSFYQRIGILYRRWVIKTGLDRAGTIVAVSEFVKQELVKILGIPASRISVIPNMLRWTPTEGRKMRTKQVVTIGGDSPTKNIQRAIAAFLKAASGQSGWTYLIFGIPESRHAAVLYACGITANDSVRLMPLVSESELRMILESASIGFVPSIDEGFGRPAIESMASGLPLVCSSGGALPEVVGDAALLVDPFSVEGMAAELRRLMLDENLRWVMSASGLRRVQQYTKESIVPQLLALVAAANAEQ